MNDNDVLNIETSKLKQLDFNQLCELYQSADKNLIDTFREMEKQFNAQEKKEIFLPKFVNLLFIFSNFYDAFFHKYNIFLLELDNPNSSINSKHVNSAKLFVESCAAQINRINSVYIHPISNEITLKKAKRAISIGLFSIVLGIGAIVLSIFLSYNSNIQITKINMHLNNGLNLIENTHEQLFKQKNIFEEHIILLEKFINCKENKSKTKGQSEDQNIKNLTNQSRQNDQN